MESLPAARCGTVNHVTPQSPSIGPAIAKSNFKPHHHIFSPFFQGEGESKELKLEFALPNI
jgi:hypothetical protein